MITVKTGDFLRACKKAQGAYEQRSSIPVLGTLRGRANGRFELSGTDMDVQLDVSLPYLGEAAAPFLIRRPAFIHHAFAHQGGAELAIAPGANDVRYASGELTIAEPPELSVDDWPELSPSMHAQWRATLSAEHLAQIARIGAAISTEETRYYLNGVFLHHLDGWTYRAAATNGHQLLAVELKMPDAAGDIGAGVIIPRKALRLLHSSFGKADAIGLEIGVRAALNEVRLIEPTAAPTMARWRSDMAGEQITLAAKMIDGRYPDYQRVIPAEVQWQVLADVRAMRRAVIALSPPGPANLTPALRIEAQDGGLTVGNAYLNSELTATVKVAARHSLPVGFQVGFNGRYLREMLDALRGEQVLLGFTDAAGPMLVRDPADTALPGVCMPMRV